MYVSECLYSTCIVHWLTMWNVYMNNCQNRFPCGNVNQSRLLNDGFWNWWTGWWMYKQYNVGLNSFRKLLTCIYKHTVFFARVKCNKFFLNKIIFIILSAFDRLYCVLQRVMNFKLNCINKNWYGAKIKVDQHYKISKWTKSQSLKSTINSVIKMFINK